LAKSVIFVLLTARVAQLSATHLPAVSNSCRYPFVASQTAGGSRGKSVLVFIHMLGGQAEIKELIKIIAF
jgi:hypothetical protein